MTGIQRLRSNCIFLQFLPHAVAYGRQVLSLLCYCRLMLVTPGHDRRRFFWMMPVMMRPNITRRPR